MTVTHFPKDADGALLEANIAALTTAIAAQGNALTKHQMSIKLDQLQRELVAHYLDTNRLTAANIIATMT